MATQQEGATTHPATARRVRRARGVRAPLRPMLIWMSASAFVACVAAKADSASDRRVPDGDASRGRAIVASGAFGCTGCHTIADVRGARGVVGPPLDGFSGRAFIAGQLPNRPDMLVAFLQDPAALVPATGMPNVRLGLDDARHVAAYLYTLAPNDAR
jgi:cytochrome c2